MNLEYIKTINFVKVNDNPIDITNIIKISMKKKFNKNSQYTIIVRHVGLTKFIGDFTLNNQYFVNEKNTKYPNNALKIKLVENGEYQLIYNYGSIINHETNKLNDCIESSTGNIYFNDINTITDKISLDYYKFSIIHNLNFYIWITEKNVSNSIIFSIVKNDKKIKPKEISQYIIDNNSKQILINLTKYNSYDFEIYEIKNNIIRLPKYKKYPVGTYQVTLNDIIGHDSNILSLNKLKAKDFSLFNTIKNKIISLKNIHLKNELNPINYYFMLGKTEFNILFDLNYNQTFIYPISPIECFLSLYLPNTKVDLIKENENFLLFKIISYQYIADSYKNKKTIINNIMKWVNIKESDINVDEYELYYWGLNYSIGNNKDLYNSYINIFEDYIINQDKDSSNPDPSDPDNPDPGNPDPDNPDPDNNDPAIPNIIDKKYLTNLKINLIANVYDDLSNTIIDSNINNIKLSYIITSITYETINTKNHIYNEILWDDDNVEWQNYNNEKNKLVTIVNGELYLKVSKKFFTNITNIDIDKNPVGTINPDNFKYLNLNDPCVHPFNRFQYWLSIKNI